MKNKSAHTLPANGQTLECEQMNLFISLARCYLYTLSRRQLLYCFEDTLPLFGHYAVCLTLPRTVHCTMALFATMSPTATT